ncbi:hypothetical protein F1880_006651 [Penicillium rolfsii]|nr:hypothetical protein F1880_006651 [Penicillium rolfsii]
MFEPTTALSLHRLSRQSLQKRYESDEEDVSESDAGGHDFVPSPTGSQRAGKFDSDLSADEDSHADPESDREEGMLAPYRGPKRQRPVSMDTVKRNSEASFVEDAYVFDPEEDLVLEFPSPDNSDLSSSLFLQPTIYVSTNTPQTTNIRSRSASPSSIISVENAEIKIATRITLMEPPTRPTLVFINSLGSRSKNGRSRTGRSRTRGTPRDRESRIFDGRFENGLEVPRLAEIKASASRDTENAKSSSDNDSTCTTPAMPALDDEYVSRPLHSATINRVSEIPVVPFLPPSPRVRPQSMYRPRPRTSGAEKSFQPMPNARPRRPTDASQRPASIRSISNSSVPSYTSLPASPFLSDRGYIPDHYSDAGSLLSRTCSPVSCASSPPQPPFYQAHSQFQPPKRGHTPSKHSVSSILAQRSPVMRRMTRKHSATSSMSSLRSEMEPPIPDSAPPQVPQTLGDHDSDIARKTSARRHARHNSAAPGAGGRKFMGLKLGKKSFSKA